MVFAICAAVSVARGLSDRRDRAAWFVLASGLGFYALSPLLAAVTHSDSPPGFPAAPDLLAWILYPCGLLAIGLLARAQRSRARGPVAGRRDRWTCRGLGRCRHHLRPRHRSAGFAGGLTGKRRVRIGRSARRGIRDRLLPVLLIAGTDDPVGAKTTTIQDLITRYMRQGQLALEYRFYAGGRHEILNEAEKDHVHRDIEHWLSQILDL